MIIDHDFGSDRVHGQRLAERAGLAYQHAAAPAQGAINRLDDAGRHLASGAGPVLPAGQYLGGGLPLVSKEPSNGVGNAPAVLTRVGNKGASNRRPSVQPTMRRRARSMTSHNHTLRFLWPTKLRNSSHSSASHRLRWAFAERRGSGGGEGSGEGGVVFFCAWQSACGLRP